MTFSELAVSTVILGISTQLSLQGWSRSVAAAAALSQRDQQLVLIDEQLLAHRPKHGALVEQRALSADRQALWLTVSLPGAESSLRRRRLFTPAGLGLCHKELTP